MNKIQRIADILRIPANEITKSERKAIGKAKTATEVCRILEITVEGNVQYVQAAMKRQKKSKETIYPYAA